MYPLTVIRVAKGSTVNVELKNDDQYVGTLEKCDLWMNVCMRNAVVNGERRVKECYIKGVSIKHIELESRFMEMQEVLQRKRREERREE